MTLTARATELAERFDAEFPAATDEAERQLASTVYRLLAEGRPVEIGRLAEASGRSEAEVSEALARPPFNVYTYRDDQGRIVGFGGLAVAATPHRLELEGRELYAWCAGDALFVPIVLDHELRIESRCPTTGRRISLTVAPDGVRELEPEGAVMSFLDLAGIDARTKQGLGDVIRSFCHFIHFFASEEAARAWVERHPGTTQLTIEEGFEFGRRSVAHVWGIPTSR